MASAKKVIVATNPPPTRTKADWSVRDPVKHRAAEINRLGGFKQAKHAGDAASPFSNNTVRQAHDEFYQKNQPREAV